MEIRILAKEIMSKIIISDKCFTEIRLGYNLGTAALQPYKQASKSYQNDTICTRKTMIFMIFIEPQNEFE